MTEARLKARLWVQALIRRCMTEDIFAAVVRAGDHDAGAVLVKLNRLDAGGCTVFTQIRDRDGQAAWLRGTGPEPVSEATADDYIARQLRYDEDLWVVEIEDRAGRHPMVEPVIAG